VQTSTPVVFDGKVFCYADVFVGWDVYPYVLALDVHEGRLVWATRVDNKEWMSWSSPAICPVNRLVLMASGPSVHLLDVDTGSEAGKVSLPAGVVNASVTVGDGVASITSHNYAGDAALHVINLDTANGQVGELLWTTATGASWGNTTAHFNSPEHGLLVIVAENACVNAYGPGNEMPVWTFPGEGDNVEIFGGFTGGVSIEGGYVYVSSFNFFFIEEEGVNGGGGDEIQFNSVTCKLDASTGEMAWLAMSPRSSAVPVVYGDIVLVSGGVIDPEWAEGAVPLVAAYDTETGERLWYIFGPGGWTNTPVVVGSTCYVGEYALGDYYESLYALDVSKTPSEPGFIVSQFDGAGGTPSYANGNIYSVGFDGLYAFGSAPTSGQPLRGDADLDCSVDIADIIFIRNRLRNDTGIDNNWQADVNGDDRIDLRDLVAARNNAGRECLMALEVE